MAELLVSPDHSTEILLLLTCDHMGRPRLSLKTIAAPVLRGRQERKCLGDLHQGRHAQGQPCVETGSPKELGGSKIPRKVAEEIFLTDRSALS